MKIQYVTILTIAIIATQAFTMSREGKNLIKRLEAQTSPILTIEEREKFNQDFLTTIRAQVNITKILDWIAKKKSPQEAEIAYDYLKKSTEKLPLLTFEAIIYKYEEDRDNWAARKGDDPYAKYYTSYNGNPFILNPKTLPDTQFGKLPRSLQEALIALNYVKFEEPTLKEVEKVKAQPPTPLAPIYIPEIAQPSTPLSPIYIKPKIATDEKSLIKELAEQKSSTFTMDEFPHFQQFFKSESEKEKTQEIFNWIQKKLKKELAVGSIENIQEFLNTPREKLPLLVLQAILNKYELKPLYTSNIGTKSEEKTYNPEAFVLTKSQDKSSPYSQFLKFPEILQLALISLQYVNIEEPKIKEIEAVNPKEKQLAEFLKDIYPKIIIGNVNKFFDMPFSTIEKLRMQLIQRVPEMEVNNLFKELTVLDPRFLLLIEIIDNRKKPLTISTETIKTQFNGLPVTIQNALKNENLVNTNATQADRKEKELEAFIKYEFPQVIENAQLNFFYKPISLSRVLDLTKKLRDITSQENATALFRDLSTLDERFLPLVEILENKNKPYIISSDIVKKQFNHLPDYLQDALKKKGFIQ